MARRAVFGFPLALLGPFGGDALWRRFPGFPALVVNAEATGLASGLGPSRCCHSGACVGCSQGCGRCGRILEDDFPGGLGARERSLSFPERRNERSERGDAGMRLGGVAALGEQAAWGDWFHPRCCGRAAGPSTRASATF